MRCNYNDCVKLCTHFSERAKVRQHTILELNVGVQNQYPFVLLTRVKLNQKISMRFDALVVCIGWTVTVMR